MQNPGNCYYFRYSSIVGRYLTNGKFLKKINYILASCVAGIASEEIVLWNFYHFGIRFNRIALQFATMFCSKISSVEYIEEIAEYDYPLRKFSKTKRLDRKKRPKNKEKEQEGKERNVECKGAKKNTGVRNRTRFVSVWTMASIAHF